MNRTVYWKRLVLVLGVFVVIVGGLFAVNHFQVQRQATAIKGAAERAAADATGDKDKRTDAIALYARYLRFNPDDQEAALKYADLLFDQHKAAPSPQTADSLVRGVELVLRAFPENADLRQRLAEVYLEAGLSENARDHLDMLLKAPKRDKRKDIELLEMRAICDLAGREPEKALPRLLDAIKSGDEHDAPIDIRIRVYQQALNLLNQSKTDSRETQIDTLIRNLQEREPYRNNIEACVVVARFELFRNQLKYARENVAKALLLAGDKPHSDALIAAAELEIRESLGVQSQADKREKFVAARGYLEKANRADPKNVQVGVFLADVLDRLGKRPDAVAVLKSTAAALGDVNDQFMVVIDHLIDYGDKTTSAELVAKVAAAAPAQPPLNAWVTYFRGRLALLDGDWAAARPLLEQADISLVRQPESHKRALMGLARVYESLQNPDKQLEYCRRALRVPGPVFPAAVICEAEALEKLGKYDEAIKRYRVLVIDNQIIALRPTLMRLRLRDILRKQPENRIWDDFDADTTIGPEVDRTDELNILLAQSLIARGGRDAAEQTRNQAKAVALLEAIVNKQPQSPLAAQAWVNLARVREAGRPDAAIRFLDEAEKKIGDSLELRLARAEALVFRPKPPAVAEFESIGERPGKFTQAEQFRLWFGLGQAAASAAASPRQPDPAIRNAMLEAAIRFLQKAAETDRRDLLSRAVLIDLAVIADRKNVLEATLAELAALEGLDGPIRSLAQIVIRLPEVRKIENKAARDAEMRALRALAESVVKVRPGWDRVYVALGRIAELEGRNEQAVADYTRAIETGSREEYVIRRTVDLYRSQKKDAMAASVLDSLATRMVLPDDLERFRKIFELLSRPVVGDDVKTVDKIAPADSKDVRILMLRGSLLAAMRKEVESENAFRAAVTIANPPLAEAWEALVGQLVRTGKVEGESGAKAAVAQAEAALPPEAQPTDAAKADLYLVFARMHEMTSDTKAAEVRFRKAVEIARGELAPHRRLVEFLMRTGRSAEADKMLLGLLQHPGQDVVRWARRYLASVSYVSKPNAYTLRGEALALIEKNLAAVNPPDPEDEKARAVIWTLDPVTRNQGVDVLVDFWKKGDLTPDESYLLGRLTYESGPSKIPESVKYFEYAARPRPGVTLEHLAVLVRVYLALDQPIIAAEKFERLITAAPNSWEACREEARLMARKGRDALLRGDQIDAKKFTDQARTLVLKFPGHDAVDAIRFRTGPLLEELGFNADAEALYKRLLTAWDSPTAHMPLAVLYVKQQKSAEAIALAWEWERKSPLLPTALILAQAVRAKRPGETTEQQIAKWLDTKIADHAGKPELVGLLEARAVLLDAQQKYTEAIEQYRTALRQGKSDSAVNNLAMLLALYDPKKADEAIRLMDELIGIRGPYPSFLDTRAVAYIVKGGDDTAKAVRDLEMALMQRYSPAYLFHLAVAYDLQGKRLERDRRIDEARKVGITSSDTHPLELRRYQEMFGPDAK